MEAIKNWYALEKTLPKHFTPHLSSKGLNVVRQGHTQPAFKTGRDDYVEKSSSSSKHKENEKPATAMSSKLGATSRSGITLTYSCDI